MSIAGAVQDTEFLFARMCCPLTLRHKSHYQGAFWLWQWEGVKLGGVPAEWGRAHAYCVLRRSLQLLGVYRWADTGSAQWRDLSSVELPICLPKHDPHPCCGPGSHPALFRACCQDADVDTGGGEGPEVWVPDRGQERTRLGAERRQIPLAPALSPGTLQAFS